MRLLTEKNADTWSRQQLHELLDHLRERELNSLHPSTSRTAQTRLARRLLRAPAATIPADVH